MKFPPFNLDIFKRSSFASKNAPTNHATTAFGKRKTSSHRTKSESNPRRTSRKRSITYYSPSKSRFYPTEYFPTLQHHLSTVSTDVAVSAAATAARDSSAVKLNNNRTYSCNNRDVVVHHDGARFSQSQLHQNKPIDHRFYAANESYEPNDNNNVQKTTVHRDYNRNGIVVVDDNAIVDANKFNRYSKECVGVSSTAIGMPNINSNRNVYVNLECDSQRQRQQQQPFHRTALHSTPNHLKTHDCHNKYHNSSGAINATTNNISLFDDPTQYTNSSNTLFHHSTMPIWKKHERHRRRKVCVLVCDWFNVTVNMDNNSNKFPIEKGDFILAIHKTADDSFYPILVGDVKQKIFFSTRRSLIGSKRDTILIKIKRSIRWPCTQAFVIYLFIKNQSYGNSAVGPRHSKFLITYFLASKVVQLYSYVICK